MRPEAHGEGFLREWESRREDGEEVVAEGNGIPDLMTD